MTATDLSWALEERAVIVTGASSGIGAATARLLGRAGASVVLVGRDEGRLERTAAEVRERGGRAATTVAHLEGPTAADAVVDAATAAFGAVHGLVHAASACVNAPLEETTAESIELHWRTNVAAPLLLTRAALPHLTRGSSIVFVGSTVASVGFPGCSAYASTKGAVDAVTRALAIELAPRGIRVNLVVPGFVRTPMLQPDLDADPAYEGRIVERTPVGRLGEPDDLAASIVFLLSGLSTYVDGAVLLTDGGWVAQ